MKKLILILMLVVVAIAPISTFAFLQSGDFSATTDPAGFAWGVWHGLLAPYSLIARWFMQNIQMYTIYNNGWFYDAGFLLGASGSIPAGWLAALFSVVHTLFF